jgi:hypothetical protein
MYKFRRSLPHLVLLYTPHVSTIISSAVKGVSVANCSALLLLVLWYSAIYVDIALIREKHPSMKNARKEP